MDIDRATIRTIAQDLETLLTDLEALTDHVGTVGMELDRLYARLRDVSTVSCRVRLAVEETLDALEETEESRALKHANTAKMQEALNLDTAIPAATDNPTLWYASSLGQTSTPCTACAGGLMGEGD